MILENTPTLATERLILRKFTKNDIKDLYNILKDEQVNEFLPWFPVRNMKETENFLENKFLKFYSKPFGYRYAICLKSNDAPIGYVWLSDDDSYDFGYGLMREFWGKGIATEAAKSVVQRIEKAGYKYITATHDINNPQSGEVMKKLGMEYKYSYIEQWQPKNKEITFRMYQLNFTKDEADTYMKYWNMNERHFV